MEKQQCNVEFIAEQARTFLLLPVNSDGFHKVRAIAYQKYGAGYLPPMDPVELIDATKEIVQEYLKKQDN
jgi:hypothetical protein